MSLSRNAIGREFQRHGPATEKLLSPRRVRVLLVAHVYSAIVVYVYGVYSARTCSHQLVTVS